MACRRGRPLADLVFSASFSAFFLRRSRGPFGSRSSACRGSIWHWFWLRSSHMSHSGGLRGYLPAARQGCHVGRRFFLYTPPSMVWSSCRRRWPFGGRIVHQCKRLGLITASNCVLTQAACSTANDTAVASVKRLLSYPVLSTKRFGSPLSHGARLFFGCGFVALEAVCGGCVGASALPSAVAASVVSACTFCSNSTPGTIRMASYPLTLWTGNRWRKSIAHWNVQSDRK